MSDEVSRLFQIFPFPEDSTIVCADSFVNNGKIHIIGGYNFVDLMNRKYNLTAAQYDSLVGKHLILEYNGNLTYKSHELPYSRLIAPSCIYCEETHSAFIFGGLHEQTGKSEDPNAIFISNLLIIHKFMNDQKRSENIHSTDRQINSQKTSPSQNVHFSQRNSQKSFQRNDQINSQKNITKNDIFIGENIIDFNDEINDHIITIVPAVGVVNPLGRFFHCAAWDSDHQCMWVFGGGTTINTKRSRFNELWQFSVLSQHWTLANFPKKISPRWGSSMVYYNNKLYVFGGTHEHSQARNLSTALHIFDTTNPQNVTFSSIKVPSELTNCYLGCKLILIKHPILGPQIVFTGGCVDSIHKSLGFSADLIVAQEKMELNSLMLVRFDIQQKKFTILNTPEEIPNVSYHSLALLDDGLFLIGGLNHSRDRRAFCRSIIRISIFDLMLPGYTELTNQIIYPDISVNDQSNDSVNHPAEIPEIYQTNFPIDSHTSFQINFTPISEGLEEILSAIVENELIEGSLDEQTTYFKQLFKTHQVNPYPISEFYMFVNVCISKNVFKARFQLDESELLNIPKHYKYDLVYYLYTGLLKPKKSQFIDFKSFLTFFKICYHARLYRLMWLEFCIHAKHLLANEILTLCVLTLDDTENLPLLENPNMTILKYALFRIMKESRNSFPFEILSEIPNSDLISDYFLPFLDDSLSFQDSVDDFLCLEVPQIPKSTLAFDLVFLYNPQVVHCKDFEIRYNVNNTKHDLSKLSNFSSIVVASVVQLNPFLLFHHGDDIVTDHVIQSFYVFNLEEQKLSKSKIETFYRPIFESIVNISRQDDTFYSRLFPLFREIKHTSLLSLLIEIFGISSPSYFIDRTGARTKMNWNYLQTKYKFTFLKFDIDPNAIFSIVLIMYLNESPEKIPRFNNDDELMKALIVVCGEYPLLFHTDTHRACAEFIKKTLLRKGKVHPSFAYEHSLRLFRLNILDDIFDISEPNKWISEIISQSDFVIDKEFGKWLLKASVELKTTWLL
ncbi:hypothetical protein TRFO_40513 [Tritrichomonas foetus]|uniref:Uncharacterized protein n=1 Tax=Tritrichomonas foetus TaxID=1144522 RepID=A0A1J4J104_9EUKA|nr:hypothetical protein TRFO_40513 [Tritrichomonas foetus]|eukprot:OHS93208.1 hypothetical protein TRFO_40513 [Tritrichomonas foetus]